MTVVRRMAARGLTARGERNLMDCRLIAGVLLSASRQDARRIAFKLLAAVVATEVVGVSLVLTTARILRRDIHAADRILKSKLSSHSKSNREGYRRGSSASALILRIGFIGI